jgi:hypothetical protein
VTFCIRHPQDRIEVCMQIYETRGHDQAARIDQAPRLRSR